MKGITYLMFQKLKTWKYYQVYYILHINTAICCSFKIQQAKSCPIYLSIIINLLIYNAFGCT